MKQVRPPAGADGVTIRGPLSWRPQSVGGLDPSPVLGRDAIGLASREAGPTNGGARYDPHLMDGKKSGWRRRPGCVGCGSGCGGFLFVIVLGGVLDIFPVAFGLG